MGGGKILKTTGTGLLNSGFLKFLDQRRNNNGPKGLLYGCAPPPTPLSVPLLEMSSE